MSFSQRCKCFSLEKKRSLIQVFLSPKHINLKIKNAWFCIKNLHTQNKTSFRQKKLWQNSNLFLKPHRDTSIFSHKMEFLLSNLFSIIFLEPMKIAPLSSHLTTYKLMKKGQQLQKEKSSQKKSFAADPKHFMTSLSQMKTEHWEVSQFLIQDT